MDRTGTGNGFLPATTRTVTDTGRLPSAAAYAPPKPAHGPAFCTGCFTVERNPRRTHCRKCGHALTR